jgi:hypothetical protein
MSEKRKKSWKEIDQQRDKSAHRREERKPSSSGRRGGDPSRSHRANLDKLFDSGQISELVKQRDAQTGVQADAAGPSRRKLEARILEAADRESKVAAIDAYLAAFSLPRDFDTVAHVLDHPDDEIVEQTLEHLEAMLEQDKPRRPRTLVAKLKGVAELNEWGRLRKKAQALLDKL